MGIQANQRIGSVWDFCKGFEDWLDLKCIFHEVIEVHVSCSHFCVVKIVTLNLRRHMAVVLHLFIRKYAWLKFALVKETLMRNFLFRLGCLTFLSPFWPSAPFGTGEIIFFCAGLSYSKLPPFSLIRDFGKQNTRENASKISVNHTCYRHVGSKSTSHSPLVWRREGQKVTLVPVIGGFRSDMSITRMIDGNFGNVSASVLFSKVAYQRKRW